MIKPAYRTGLLNWLFPPCCIACRKWIPSQARGFCNTCWRNIPWLPGPLCRRCGLSLRHGGGTCWDCAHARGGVFAFEIARAPAQMAGPLRSAIHAFKYRGRRDLATPLASLLVRALARYPELWPIDCVVPVPLHWIAERRRGYNQAMLLSREMERCLRIPCVSGLQRRRYASRSQVSLPQEERRSRLRGAFQTDEPMGMKTQHILLVDDVCTTGATLHECAKTLRDAGYRHIKALTLAREV